MDVSLWRDAGKSAYELSETTPDEVLRRPPRLFDAIDRPRLTRRLERAATYRVTVVAAPAGYGKSVAVRHFLAQCGKRVVRIDVGRESAGVRGVIRAFGHALDGIVPGAPELLAQAIERFGTSSDVRTGLIDALIAVLPATETVCAVDGLTAQTIDDEFVRELLVRSIERSGDHVHWLIATRAVGRFPLASWLAYGVMDAPISEAELAFTSDEAQRVAVAAASTRTPEQIEKLFALTQGWPTAFVLALRTPNVPDQLTTADSSQMIFDYLAEQVFGMLDQREREFLFATCVLPSIDLPVVEMLGIPDAREIIGRLRKQLPLSSGDTEGSFTYQPLFRGFLEYQLRLCGEADFRAALISAAGAFETLGRKAAAFDLYLRAQAGGDVERLLEDHGFDFLEHGDLVLVSEGIGFLRQRGYGGSPSVRALRGTLEASAGNTGLSQTFFESALVDARDAGERSRIAFRYALELIKRNEPSAVNALEWIVPVLEAARVDTALAPSFNPALAGTLAIAYSMLDRAPEAMQRMGEALASVSAVEDPRSQALIFHQASYIAYVVGDAKRGSRLAASAFRLAVEQRNFRLATRSSSIRFSIARGLADDPQQALEYLIVMHEFAERSIDRDLQSEALAGMMDIEAERGNEVGVREIEARIEACHEDPENQTTAVLPALALVAAWHGDFQSAYDRLVGTDADQSTPLRRGLRLAEIALYAAGSHRRDAAIEAAGNALQLARSAKVRTIEDRRRYARILALCALAYVTIGTTATANSLLAELERSRREMSARTRVVIEAVRALYLRAEIGSEEPLATALAGLRAAGLGGLALLIEALPPNRSTTKSLISLLTPAEIEVLRALARGGSSTKVAAELARSVNTVNVHVKSIMRKLSCATRYEAIAIAREHGLVS